MRILVLALSAVLVGALPAFACRCAQRTLVHHFADADLVFLGIAAPQGVGPADWQAGAISLRFHLLGEAYKGDPGPVRVYRTGEHSANCGVPIEAGAPYLIFAKRDLADPTVAVFSTCNGARPFDATDPDDASGFPDVIAERVLDALSKLRIASHAATRPIGGVPLDGSMLGLVALPSTFDRDVEENIAEVPYATLPLHVEPKPDSPVIFTVESEADVQTREHGYELDAAVVVAEHDGWLQLRKKSGVLGWLDPPASATYWPLEKLLPQRLGYFTGAWDGRLWPDPGAGLPYEPRTTENSREPVVDIMDARRVADSLWLKVKLWRHNPCDGPEQNSAEIGWVPAWSATGELTTWFWSRGC